CDNSKEIIITDFSKPVNIALSVNPDKAYTTKLLRVRGQVDDTVIVGVCEKCRSFYLNGKIDTLFNPDFYGGQGMDSTYFYFDPYKSKNGELKLTFSIL
ncbi:MAG: hypothetical protein WD597_01310, partial [Balneolaceae bacterium]